jgi:hypothetical protein
MSRPIRLLTNLCAGKLLLFKSWRLFVAIANYLNSIMAAKLTMPKLE